MTRPQSKVTVQSGKFDYIKIERKIDPSLEPLSAVMLKANGEYIADFLTENNICSRAFLVGLATKLNSKLAETRT